MAPTVRTITYLIYYLMAQMEEKLTQIYHEFGRTIREGEPDESVVARAKDWFVYRLHEETDNEVVIENLATQLANMVAQAAEIKITK